MGMLDWAKNEVDIACKREAPDRKPGEWDYGCACYESALKAYESLINDGHSGLSWSLAKQILMRLMDGKPLTPIEDIPENWEESEGLNFGKNNYIQTYQCTRMPSLFKYIDKNGKVTYRDVDRVVCRHTDSDICYHNGLASRIVNEMFPITMPYIPADKPFIVDCYEFLIDEKNGDYDMICFTKLHKPDGEVIDVNRYFAERNGCFEEINHDEMNKRFKKRYYKVMEEDSDK